MGEINSVLLEKVKIGMRECVSQYMVDSLEIEKIEEKITNTLIYNLKAYVLSESLENRSHTVKVSYPDGAWQMFKESHFPKFLLRKFPVKSKEVERTVIFTKTAIYPKLPLAIPGTKAVIKYSIREELK